VSKSTQSKKQSVLAMILSHGDVNLITRKRDGVGNYIFNKPNKNCTPKTHGTLHIDYSTNFEKNISLQGVQIII